MTPNARRRRAAITAALIACGLLTGCATPEPWVRPYEREALANPLMALSRDPIMDRHVAHVYEVREGARGANGAAGGGCGCN